MRDRWGVDIQLGLCSLQGWTALHCAAMNGHEAVVRFLVVERGAMVDATNNAVRWLCCVGQWG